MFFQIFYDKDIDFSEKRYYINDVYTTVNRGALSR